MIILAIITLIIGIFKFILVFKEPTDIPSIPQLDFIDTKRLMNILNILIGIDAICEIFLALYVLI